MTLIDNSTSNSTVDSRTSLLQISLWSVRLVCPLLIIICPVTNWACIRIFQSRIYARSSSKWYFIYIAIFDTIYVLVTAPLIFLITLEIYILNWNILLCKSIVFFNYLSCQISAGLLACLSIDRLIATTSLSLYRQNCTTYLSKFVCLAVILIFSVVNSHYLIGYTIDSNGFCSVRHYKWYETNYSRLNVVYLLSYSIIPFTIITICNLFTVLSVCQNKTNMRKKYENKKPRSPSNIPHEQPVTPDYSLKVCDESSRIFKSEQYSPEKHSINENKHEMFVSINDKQVINKLLDTNCKFSLKASTSAI
jgi:hypothetical protein